MNQRAVQIIVALFALIALAMVVYRAQRDAPSPPTDPTEITHDRFLPSSKTDAGAGARPKVEPVEEKDPVGKPVNPNNPNNPNNPDNPDPPDTDEPEDTRPTLQLSDEVFFPSTKSGPLRPITLPEREPEGE